MTDHLLKCHRCANVWLHVPAADKNPYVEDCPSCKQWNLVRRAEERAIGTLNRAVPAELLKNNPMGPPPTGRVDAELRPIYDKDTVRRYAKTYERKKPMTTDGEKRTTFKAILSAVGATSHQIAELGYTSETGRRLIKGIGTTCRPDLAAKLEKRYGITIPAYLIRKFTASAAASPAAPKERKRKWSKKARIRLHRSRAMKKVWMSKKKELSPYKTNGNGGYLIIHLTKDTPEILVINTKTRRTIPSELVSL